MKKAKKSFVKKRDGNILAHLRGEINLSTKSESLQKKKYSRKSKHRASYE